MARSEQDILAADADSLHKMGYAQELSRRMGGFSNFAVSFSIICILAGGITSFQVGFCTGGAFTTIVGWIVGSLFALIVGLSMAQIASAYPTAGGLYHWSSILGGRGWGWATAWFNMLGLIFVIASVNVGVYSLFTGLILGNIFGINTSSWGFEQQTIAVVLITLSQGLFNHFGIRTTTKLIDFSGYLILVVAILLTIAMLFGASHIDFSRLLAFHNNSGAPGGSVVPASTSPFYLFLLALLYPLYTITGFDGSAHTSEETIDARHNVPKGMLNAIIWSAIFGLDHGRDVHSRDAKSGQGRGRRRQRHPQPARGACRSTNTSRTFCISASWSPIISARWPVSPPPRAWSMPSRGMAGCPATSSSGMSASRTARRSPPSG